MVEPTVNVRLADPNPTFLSSFSPMSTPSVTLRASIEKHNDAFESLLKLIPAKYYVVQDQAEEQVRTLCSQPFG